MKIVQVTTPANQTPAFLTHTHAHTEKSFCNLASVVRYYIHWHIDY